MLGLVKLWKTWGTENVRLVSNEEGYLKRTSKPRHMSQEMFDNDLVAILKSKFTLTLNKLAYVGMCLLLLSKVFMYEFHYKYIKKKFYKTPDFYSLRVIFWCMKWKLKTFMKIYVKIRKCLILVIIQLSQNIMMIQTN